jgi:hypothetical protein
MTNEGTSMTRSTFPSFRQAGIGLLCAALSGSSLAASEPPPSDRAQHPTDLPTPEQMAEDPAQAGLELFDLLEGAERAEKQKDYATAAKYYLTLARIVPERATAFSKLCEMYEALGQREQGIAACYRATGLEGAKVADNLRYVRLLLSAPENRALTPSEVAAVRATLEHLAKAGVESPEIDLLGCQFAVSLENDEAMRGCVRRLEQTQPGSPVALTYRLSLALFERDFARARACIEEARRMSMNPESISLMERQLDAVQNGGGGGPAPKAGPAPWLLSAAGFAVALAAWGFVVRGKRRRLTSAL